MKSILFFICSSLFLYSCGSEKSSDREAKPDRQEEEIVTDSDGTYKAIFETLNPHVNGTLPGSLTISMNDNRLLFYARLFAGKPKTWHPQAIYMGKRCPNLGDDTNGDGFIDIIEAMKVVGKQIIPVDGNLNSQKAGINFYPLSDPSGYYHYERAASLSSMMKDLTAENTDPEGPVTKLGENENFSFQNKVFLVQGIDEATELPETVATLGKRKNFQTLPIACGVIRKFEGTVGTPYSENIPWTIAEVQEGQDRPAPSGVYETWDEDTTNGPSDSDTNDSTDGEVTDGETTHSTSR